MQEVTYNVATGETTYREFTPEEIAAMSLASPPMEAQT